MPIVHRVATFNKYSDAGPLFYAVLFKVSSDYPPVNGRLHTRYAPVRRSPSTGIATRHAAPRLACVRPAASVYPEPGSNSPLSNPSPDSLLKSTSPLLYTPLPIFFLRYYRSAIGSGYLIFSKNSLTHGRPLSLHLISLAGPSPFAGAKIRTFFSGFQKKSTKNFTFFYRFSNGADNKHVCKPAPPPSFWSSPALWPHICRRCTVLPRIGVASRTPEYRTLRNGVCV